MIMRIWHLSDAPEVDKIGTPYLHREVEDWMSEQIDSIPEEEWEAPDLAVSDAAGVTTFVAAFGLDNLATADVQGMGRLAEYPGELVFVGIAQKFMVTEPAEPMHIETEEYIDQRTGQRMVRIVNDSLPFNWKMPTTELRIRGLVVDKTTQEQTEKYVEGQIRKKDGKVDIML
jgi:hypothetical protein